MWGDFARDEVNGTASSDWLGESGAALASLLVGDP